MKKNKPDIKALASKYMKVVEWSDEDRCFIGSATPLTGSCCHGNTAAAVLERLQEIVEDLLRVMLEHGEPLHPHGNPQKYSGRLVLRVGKNFHRLLAIRAMQEGGTLNDYAVKLLKKES